MEDEQTDGAALQGGDGAALQGGDGDARREAARLMGQASTEQKAAAARANGRKGGRPKGIPASKETKRKISEARRCNTTPPETSDTP